MKHLRHILKFYSIHFALMAAMFFFMEFAWARYDGIPHDFGRYILKALIMGGALTLMFVAMELYEWKQLGIPYTDENYLNSKPIKTITSKYSLDELSDKLTFFSDYHSIQKSGDNQLTLKIAQSWKSLGENMTIEQFDTKDDLYTYKVQSQSSYKLPRYDYAKNLENIIKLEFNLGQTA